MARARVQGNVTDPIGLVKGEECGCSDPATLGATERRGGWAQGGAPARIERQAMRHQVLEGSAEGQLSERGGPMARYPGQG
jgi:hypothetical protein